VSDMSEYSDRFICTAQTRKGEMCEGSAPARPLWIDGDFGASGMSGQAVCEAHDGRYTVVRRDGVTYLIVEGL
jgi:hypothetical protein